jgi:hypothetical protein
MLFCLYSHILLFYLQDCDSDSDCEYGLACFQREDMAIVDGCNGTGVDGKDYCYIPPPGTLILMGDDMAPIRNFPLGVCEGGMCYSRVVVRFCFNEVFEVTDLKLTIGLFALQIAMKIVTVRESK